MQIIIYGAGGNCKHVMDKEEVRQNNILCIADKDIKKSGMNINGIDVVLPEQIKGYEYDFILVTVNRKLGKIKKELAEIGIPEDKIIYWKDYVKVSPRNIGTMTADWSKGLRAGDVYGELCSHLEELNDMEAEFLTGRHKRSFKWLHYFEIYNRHLSKYIGKDITIMEIGIDKGGSLQIWKKIFGPKAKIIGIDIEPSCKEIEDEQIEVYIGDQADRDFWKRIKTKIPKVDILIDDGGHYMEQQIVTFEEMFPHIKDDGVYLCEDTGTSYDSRKYDSGYKKENTFIEYSKNFIDYIHAWFATGQELQVNEYTRSMHSLHYYFGVLVVEKKVMYPPMDMEVCNTDEEKYALCHFHEIL